MNDEQIIADLRLALVRSNALLRSCLEKTDSRGLIHRIRRERSKNMRVLRSTKVEESK